MQVFNALRKARQVYKDKKKNDNPVVYGDKNTPPPNATYQLKQATIPSPNEVNPQPLQVMIYTHNIRCDSKNLMDKEKPWKYRKDGVVNLIKQITSEGLPTLIGLQEVLHNQLSDIMNQLGSDFTYFGVARDDGQTKGEFSPIIFNKNDWEIIEGKTFWLSQTPNIPSKSWDAAYNRIVNSVIIKHRLSNKVINFYNTHYDHKGKEARKESSKLILKIMNDKPGDNILVGDLNSDPNGKGYQVLDENLHDSSKYAEKVVGNKFTCVGFNDQGESIIDFVWVSPKLRILFHEVIPRPNGSECNCSDHLPVKAVVEI